MRARQVGKHGDQGMKATRDLPLFVRDLLASPPRAGEGVNRYLFRLARVLHPYRSVHDIIDTLRALTANCGRTVTENEILRAVERSKACAWTPGQGAPERATPPWPPLNAEQREAVIAGIGRRLVDLWEMSPVRFPRFCGLGCDKGEDSHEQE
jgi:hypothetical protein